MTSAVALVLDQNFGDRILRLAQEMPVWIVSSDTNDRAVEHARRMLNDDANITGLFAGKGESLQEIFLRALYDIDEHHGESSSCAPYDRVLVFGGAPDLLTAEVKVDLGFESVRKSDFGFSVKKKNLQPEPQRFYS